MFIQTARIMRSYELTRHPLNTKSSFSYTHMFSVRTHGRAKVRGPKSWGRAAMSDALGLDAPLTLAEEEATMVDVAPRRRGARSRTSLLAIASNLNLHSV